MLNSADLRNTRLSELHDLPFYVGILALVAAKLSSSLSHDDVGYFLTFKLKDGARVHIRESNFSIATYPSWCIEFRDQRNQYQLRTKPRIELFVFNPELSRHGSWERCELLI